MKDIKKIIVLVVVSVLGAVLMGGTYAYFAASKNGTGTNITGNTFNFGASISMTNTYQATQLVPLSDSLIGTAVSKSSNKCRDASSYQVCSLYKITISNSGDPVTLYPYITTTSSTYTTNNLKCKLFNSSFTAVSDVITLSRTANAKTYITSSSSNYAVNMTSTSQVYYLAIWLSDTNASQTTDYSKTFSGTITFEAPGTGSVKSSFTA